MTTLEYQQYIKNWVIGSRRYLLKLEDETIPKAKRIYNILFWIDIALKTALYGGVAFLAYRKWTGRLDEVPEFVESFDFAQQCSTL